MIIVTSRIKSSRREILYKNVVLRNFAKFTGKHLRKSLFLNKDLGLYNCLSLAEKAKL